MNPVCVPCQVEFVVKEAGVMVSSMTRKGPYEQHLADLLECPICGVQILYGFGYGPCWGHWSLEPPEPTPYCVYAHGKETES